MTKIMVSMALIMVSFWNIGISCDACGCTAKGVGFDLLSAYNRSYLAVRYIHTPFQSVLKSSDGSKDNFHQFELSARYGLNNKLFFQFSQPYSINQRVVLNTTQIRNDFGDSRISAHYIFKNKVKLGIIDKFYFDGGLGIKTPFGSYDPKLHDVYELPENFNPGNGSWAMFLQSNQMLSFSSFGVLIGESYQHNFVSESGYHFGDQVASQLLAFYQFEKGKATSLTTMAGLNYEIAFRDKKPDGKYANSTGGFGVLASFGLNLKFDKYIFSALASAPIIQDISNGEVKAGIRTSLQFSYLF